MSRSDSGGRCVLVELELRVEQRPGHQRDHRQLLALRRAHHVLRLDVERGIQVGRAEIADVAAHHLEVAGEARDRAQAVVAPHRVQRAVHPVRRPHLLHPQLAVELDVGFRRPEPEVVAHGQAEVAHPYRLQHPRREVRAESPPPHQRRVHERQVLRVLEVDDALVDQVGEVEGPLVGGHVPRHHEAVERSRHGEPAARGEQQEVALLDGAEPVEPRQQVEHRPVEPLELHVSRHRH